MERRLKLQQVLEDLLGSRNVYFQPPPSVKMKYPAIVYDIGELGFRTNLSTAYANSELYALRKTYTVTVIDANPDTKIPDKLQHSLEYCSFARAFQADSLNHYVFTLYW